MTQEKSIGEELLVDVYDPNRRCINPSKKALVDIYNIIGRLPDMYVSDTGAVFELAQIAKIAAEAAGLELSKKVL